MNKLQLYINTSGEEYKNILNQNPDEEVRRRLIDVRGALRIPAYDVQEKNTFYFVQYIESGMLIGVISTIIGQKANHVIAWIFVPYNLQIDAEELLEVVRFVARKISHSVITPDDYAELRTTFSTEYATKADAACIVGNFGEGYAFRYYGGDTDCELIDLLGVYLYQSAYLPYAGVLLVDASNGIECTGSDLTDIPFEQMVTMLPPKEHPEDFKPYLFEKLFNEPMLAPLNKPVEIVWKRPGFEDIHQQVTVSAPDMQPQCPEASESKKLLTMKSFSVTSLSTRNNITRDCTITINGIDIKDGHSFTLSELANAEITVNCDGYESYTMTLNLAQSSQTMIQLRERGKVYNFEISAKSSDIAGMIRFQINTTVELTDSPIDGYELTDDIQEGPSRSNHLVYDGGDRSKSLIHNLIWAIAGAIIGVLVALLCTCGGSEASTEATDEPQSTEATDNTPTKPEAQELPAPAPAAAPATAASNPSRNLQAAVEFLDANRYWVKDSLEQFPDLRGLYEDMNNLNRQRLYEVWGPKLKDSRQFANVADHAEKGVRLKKKPRLKADQKTYNTDDDHSISVQSYLNTIDP